MTADRDSKPDDSVPPATPAEAGAAVARSESVPATSAPADAESPTVQAPEADMDDTQLDLLGASRSRSSRPPPPPEGGAWSEGPWADRLSELEPSKDAVTLLAAGVHLKKATLIGPATLESGAPLSKRGPKAYLGCTIDDRYEITELIAEGGMGVVFLGRHRVIDRPVAIKILRGDLVSDREVTERFLTEAKAASSVGSVHIVDVIDFGELPDGAAYLAMEYLDGQPLGSLMTREGRLEPERVVHICRQIAEAVGAAHTCGIVHRDLKPDNIFIIEHGKEKEFVKILDFGIAKVARGQNKLTREGTIFGTPHYMSPEQGTATEVDHRSDIYSLGVIAYEMLAGSVPFDAENPLGIVTQHLYTDAEPLEKVARGVPPGLARVVHTCLAKDPDERYASMEEVVAAFDSVARGELPAERVRAGGGGASTSVARVVGLAVAGVMLAGGALWALGAGDGSSEPAAVASADAASDAGDAGEPANDAPEARYVAVVVSPIDAKVYRGSRSLGEMPVTLAVPPGGKVQIVVRREGFHDQRVTVDGSKRKIIVKLKPIPGVTPSKPVPEAGPSDLDGAVAPDEEEVDELLPDASAPADAGAAARRDASAKRDPGEGDDHPGETEPPPTASAAPPKPKPKPKAEPKPAASSVPED